ncbi:uncharacterized protein LOC132575750 [Heteronotia binoei]|uniref:uncharacterized protein LOC132575750 n=1 Tax=Heteronotia binoei TaxID=13085 RepID=UPI0029314679|nr:uncharacterized protein LOC132575750 [Heteronotia binoei]
MLLSNAAKEDFKDWHLKINDLQRGIQVLARKKIDGYFYRGHIIQHMEGSRGHILIEFERSKKAPKVKADFRMQETPLYDVVHHEDGRWQPVAVGDRVLAPWEKKGERYGPGTALQVTETDSSHSAFKNSEVLVNFWNGKTKKVPSDIAVKIPLPLSERIILELQMPLAARQMLVEQNPNYPYTVPPGYRASGACWHSHLDCSGWSDASKVPHVSTTHFSPQVPLWHFCPPAWECISSPITLAQPEDFLIPGNDMTKEELNRKVEEQLARGRLFVLEDSENKESRKPKEKKNVADLISCKESETKAAISNKTHQKESASEDPREGTGTRDDVAVNTDKCTPWQELEVFPQPSMNKASAQPFHQSRPGTWELFIAPIPQVDATFVWVDQSMKEDRSVIESVLHMRRSHSEPAIQRVPVTAASLDSPREAARIEFRRQKREQRQLKEEQKQREECIQKELLCDIKRHRLLQRSLQGSQKQQENSERAQQRLAKLQVAREEQMRQESCLREEEKNKESQRLEFLKVQRRQRDQQLMERKQRVDAQDNKRLELLKNRVQSMQRNLKAAGQEQDPKEKKVAAKR